MRDGIAHQVEPAPAAVNMGPALSVAAGGVRSKEEVARPGLLVDIGCRHADVGLAAIAELDFFAWTAPGTSN